MTCAPDLSAPVFHAPVFEQIAHAVAPMQRAAEQVQRSLRPVFEQIETMRRAVIAAQSELRAYKAEQRARRAEQREQAQRNNQRLLQFLHTHLTRRTSAHLGLNSAPCVHDRPGLLYLSPDTYTGAPPLATCHASNAPGAQSMTQQKLLLMRT